MTGVAGGMGIAKRVAGKSVADAGRPVRRDTGLGSVPDVGTDPGGNAAAGAVRPGGTFARVTAALAAGWTEERVARRFNVPRDLVRTMARHAAHTGALRVVDAGEWLCTSGGCPAAQGASQLPAACTTCPLATAR
ncbi:MAG: hypothetical protein LBM66_07785 [Bifidobacteriaceae bacterium]|jgi:hypothetical protein|nr:hypothetical protein [Bifidobacteriaceae bacterium]